MRSYTFDVMVRTTANGRTAITQNAHWLKLAGRLSRSNKVALCLTKSTFAGYGSSYDVGYTRYTYTVTELPGAFLVA
jgi:hypothetical protein